MKVVALISGGKDSSYNMMHCVAAGHQIVALANLRPTEDKEGFDELDSYMYQTVGHQAIELYAEAMGLPLYRHMIKGTSVNTGSTYTKCEGDEVEDLYQLLKLVKNNGVFNRHPTTERSVMDLSRIFLACTLIEGNGPLL